MKTGVPCLHRDHARLSRDLASRLPDCETKQHLFDMASLYDAIAEISEQQSKSSSPNPGLSNVSIPRSGSCR